MITQQQLDEQGERVKALADTIEALAVSYHEEMDKLKKMINTWKIQTWVYGEEAKFVMNTQAPLQAPALQVLPSPTESPLNADSSDLGRVRVDWAGRGVNTGSYPILAEDEKSYTIDNGTDPAKPMRLRISKTRCEKVTVVVVKAA